jgi:hypothetical protein
MDLVKNIMDNSIKILCKEVVIVNGLMGPLIKELGEMVKSMEKEFINGRMDQYMMENG